jgi:DNA replication protein DnaC
MKSQKNPSTFNTEKPVNRPPDYNCAACRDCGYIDVFVAGVHTGVAHCKCSLRKFKIKYFGELFADKTLENYEGRNASMKDAREFILKNPNKSFYIFGQVGLGKTHLLAGIYEKMYFTSNWTTTGIFKESALLEAVKTQGLISRVREYTGFIIDDLGKVKLAPWETEALFNFYDDIYRFEKQIIISSNYSLQEIAKYYGGAIARRIEERSEIIEIKGGQ